MTKEDEQLYEHQLKDHSGYATNEKVEYKPHPSKIRILSQSAKFDHFEEDKFQSECSADSEYYPENESTPKKVYKKASSVAIAVNNTQISCTKAHKFLRNIDELSSKNDAPSTSGIYKVMMFYCIIFILFLKSCLLL